MASPTPMQVDRIAVFSDGAANGNPAGVMLLDTLPNDTVMQAVASEVGYLRDLGWSHEGSIEIVQGEDMGCRSRLSVEIGVMAGEDVRVSGATRILPDALP